MAMTQDGNGNAPEHPYDRWIIQATATLSHRLDADALVTAAMLQPLTSTSSASALPLLDQASRLAPTGADIAALAMLECEQTDGCDAPDRARHLQALAPDNALAWLTTLRTAHARNDEQKVTQTLLRMAQTENFETYQIPLTKRVQLSLNDLPPVPDMGMHHPLSDDHAGLLQTSILVSLLPIPRYKDLVQACRPDDAEFASRQLACRQIAAELTRSWSLIANEIGVLLQRWTARNTREYQQALASERETDWLVSIRQSCDQAHILICLDADTKATSELAASRIIAHQLGKPVTPPDTWVDQHLQSSIRQDRQRFHPDPSAAGSDADGKTSPVTSPAENQIKSP